MNTDKIHWIYVEDEFGDDFSQHEDVDGLLRAYNGDMQNVANLNGVIERALKSGRKQYTEAVELITDYIKELYNYRDDSGYLRTAAKIVTGPIVLNITACMDKSEEVKHGRN